MIKFFLITACLAFNVASSCGQRQLLRKFTMADSVILVSHLTTSVPNIDSVTKKWVAPVKLVEKKIPNYKIIKESVKLTTTEVDSITSLLTTLNKDTIIKDGQCFIPHHGILIFKNGKCSYFDICFECRHFITSRDIALSDMLSDKTWNTLEFFFRNRNLNYGMPGNGTDGDDEN